MVAMGKCLKRGFEPRPQNSGSQSYGMGEPDRADSHFENNYQQIKYFEELAPWREASELQVLLWSLKQPSDQTLGS